MKQTHARKIRILFADSHPQLREPLISLLVRESDFDVVGIAVNSAQTLKEAQANQPDLLLIDPIMRDGFGLATLRQIHANMPTMMIVVLTAFIDTTLKLELHEMGIRHRLTKGILFSQLAAQLRDAAMSSASSLSE